MFVFRFLYRVINVTGSPIIYTYTYTGEWAGIVGWFSGLGPDPGAAMTCCLRWPSLCCSPRWSYSHAQNATGQGSLRTSPFDDGECALRNGSRGLEWAPPVWGGPRHPRRLLHQHCHRGHRTLHPTIPLSRVSISHAGFETKSSPRKNKDNKTKNIIWKYSTLGWECRMEVRALWTGNSKFNRL